MNKNSKEWVRVSDFLELDNRWSRFLLYEEFKEATLLKNLGVECDLKEGVHFQNTSRGKKPYYMVNAELLLKVLSTPKDERIPKRPLDPKLKESIRLALAS